jgi:hypothetical protein
MQTHCVTRRRGLHAGLPSRITTEGLPVDHRKVSVLAETSAPDDLMHQYKPWDVLSE